MKSDYHWFRENRDSIIKSHLGQRVVICNQEILGYYDDYLSAIENTLPLKPGEYCIQRCLPEHEDQGYFCTTRGAINEAV